MRKDRLQARRLQATGKDKNTGSKAARVAQAARKYFN
jgi:hypothetical protein